MVIKHCIVIIKPNTFQKQQIGELYQQKGIGNIIQIQDGGVDKVIIYLVKYQSIFILSKPQGALQAQYIQKRCRRIPLYIEVILHQHINRRMVLRSIRSFRKRVKTILKKKSQLAKYLPQFQTFLKTNIILQQHNKRKRLQSTCQLTHLNTNRIYSGKKCYKCSSSSVRERLNFIDRSRTMITSKQSSRYKKNRLSLSAK